MVPEGWSEKKLSEIADYRRGSFPQPYGLEKWFDVNGHSFVQVYDVDKNLKLKPETKASISSLAADQSVFAPKGTILITLQGSIGRIAITQYSAYVDRTLLVIKNFKIPGEKYYFALSLQVLFEIEKKKAPGGTIKTITKAVLNNFSVLWPPPDEQKKIAKILQTWDRAIATTEKLIEASKQQKKALMQQLLTGKKRFAGFEGEWEKVPLEDMGKITSGGTPDTSIKEYWNGNIPWLTPTDVTKLKGRYIESTTRKITPSGIKNSSAMIIPKGCLMVCTRATIGDLAISTSDITTNQGFKNIIPNENYDIEFIYYGLRNITKYLRTRASGSTFLELSKKDFARVEILCPKINEQRRVASTIVNSDSEIIALEKKVKNLKQEKKALMQQLLTGKRRVKVDG